VYLILVLHGIGILMPWNMFINAKSVSINLICINYYIIIFTIIYFVHNKILKLIFIKNVINVILN